MRSPTHLETTIGRDSEFSFGKEPETAIPEKKKMLIMSISTDEPGQSKFCIPATKQDEDNIKGQNWSMAKVTL